MTEVEPQRRPCRKRLMHFVRRAHMYCGLFLLPWAVLYGITGFLFNHPTAFADTPTKSFGETELAGTPFAARPAPAEYAASVLQTLPQSGAETLPNFVLVEPEHARYTRDFAFATVKTDSLEISLLFDIHSPSGTIRAKQLPKPASTKSDSPRAIFFGLRTEKTGAKFRIPSALDERLKATVPVVLERSGFASGAVTVTSVPDLVFFAHDGTTKWRFTYNAVTETLSGVPADAVSPPEELSTRRFLTRLHLAHGFPNGTNAKWFWALIVDAMAFVMVFWGISGLFMWWQLKASRKWGLLVLLVSVTAATALGFGMHTVLSLK
jgi:hypothetical protein